MLSLFPQRYVGGQLSWTKFLDVKVKDKNILKQLIELPVAVSNALYLHNKGVGVGGKEAGIYASFKDPGEKFWWYPLWALKVKYGLKEDFSANLDYVDLFNRYIDFCCDNKLHTKKLLKRELAIWAGVPKEDFFNFIFNKVYPLPRRWYETKEEVTAQMLSSVRAYRKLFDVDEDLLTTNTLDAKIFRRWIAKKYYLHEAWKVVRAYPMPESLKKPLYRYLFFRDYASNLLFKPKLRLLMPYMKLLAGSVFTPSFLFLMRERDRKTRDFLPLLAKDNEWVFKNHLFSSITFGIFMAYMYRRDADIGALWEQMPDDFEAEMAEEINDQEFFYEWEFREKNFFEPLYKYFVSIDKYLFSYNLPYWSFHKDIDNDLLVSADIFFKHFSKDRKGKVYRNQMPLDYYRSPLMENCLLENFFYWFWMFPLFIALCSYRWIFGDDNYPIWYDLKHFFYNLLTSFKWGYYLEYCFGQITIFANIEEESNNSAWYVEGGEIVDLAYASRVVYGHNYWKQNVTELFLNDGVGMWGLVHHYIGINYHITSRDAGCFIYRFAYGVAMLVVVGLLIKYLLPDYLSARLCEEERLARIQLEKQKNVPLGFFKEPRLRRLAAFLDYSTLLRSIQRQLRSISERRTTHKFLSKWAQLLDVQHFYKLQVFQERYLRLQQLFFEKWRGRGSYANNSYYSKPRPVKKKKARKQ